MSSKELNFYETQSHTERSTLREKRPLLRFIDDVQQIEKWIRTANALGLDQTERGSASDESAPSMIGKKYSFFCSSEPAIRGA